MKKSLSVIPFFLFLLDGILPLFSILGWICGYRFDLRNYPVCSAVLAVISVISFVFLFLFKPAINKCNIVFASLLLPMSAVSGICYLLHDNTKLTVVFTLISCCCVLAIFFKFAGPPSLKIVSVILSVLLFLLLLLISMVGNLRSNTVVKHTVSPHNQYTAEVLDDDQGAIGGNTQVIVRDNRKEIDFFVGRFLKQPVRVYTGKWGESKSMQISWKDEHVLMIDGKEYIMPD